MNLSITLKLCGFKKTKFWREGVQELGLGCPGSGSLIYLQSGCGWGLQAPEVQFSRSVVSDSLQPHDTACQTSLSITNSRSLLKLMSIESVMPSSHLTLCCPLLLLPRIPPSIKVFSNKHPAVSTNRTAGSHACRQEASVLRVSASPPAACWHGTRVEGNWVQILKAGENQRVCGQILNRVHLAELLLFLFFLSVFLLSLFFFG